MALDEIGMGLGGGTLLGTVLTYLGIKQRVDRNEKSIDDIKKNVRYVDTCLKIHEATDRRLESIESKQDSIEAKQDRVLEIVLELKGRK